MIVYALKNETVDELAFRTFKKTAGIVEQIYNLNPKLCELPAKLPHGTAVIMPDLANEPQKKQIKLWD